MTWIGDLPASWAKLRLDELVEPDAPIIYGIIQPGPEQTAGVPYIRPTEIIDGRIAIDELRKTTPEIALRYARSTLRGGDILLSIVGTVGKVALVPDQLTGANITQCSVRIRVDESASCKAWIAYGLQTPAMTTQFKSMMFGVAVRRLNVAHVRETELPVPPLNEQRRIVAKLDALFEQTRTAKARLERLPILLERLKRAILASAFRGDLTKDWRAAHPDVEPVSMLLERIRAERRRRWEEGLQAKGKDPKKASYEEPAVVDAAMLPALPAGWAWTSLEAITDPHRVIRYGILMPGEDFPGGVPYVKVRNIKQDRILLDDVLRTSPGIHAKFKGAELAERDLLVTIRGTWGRVAQVPPELVGGNITQDTARIAPLNVIDPEYLANALRAPWSQMYLDGVAKGMAVKGVNITDLRCTPIPIPSRAEQTRVVRAIASALDVVESMANLQDSALARVSRLEKAALAKAFRGELVQQDPTDEPASVVFDHIRAARAAETKQPRRGRSQRRGDTAMAEPNPMIAGRSQRRGDTAMAEPNPMIASNGHATNGHHGDSLDLVVAIFQSERRLTATAIAKATGLDTSAVKKALKSLVEAGQVRINGAARGTTYVWSP